ncbi:hypothetical protein JZ751_013108 [Albula glossodonta]|uniref:Uncharacterized protein n=1 Tax=Albula glossodonta TaxID=121402 RepID=A0A8T2NWR3_9TELE|nr:hypothetical protein JZ751_013108 [Albula glossodonta]
MEGPDLTSYSAVEPVPARTPCMADCSCETANLGLRARHSLPDAGGVIEFRGRRGLQLLADCLPALLQLLLQGIQLDSVQLQHRTGALFPLPLPDRASAHLDVLLSLILLLHQLAGGGVQFLTFRLQLQNGRLRVTKDMPGCVVEGAVLTHVIEHLLKVLQLSVVGLARLQLGHPSSQCLMPLPQAAQAPKSIHCFRVTLRPTSDAFRPRPTRLRQWWGPTSR